MSSQNLKENVSGDMKCASCGGLMEYNIETSSLQCLHCKSAVIFESDEIVEKKPFEKLEEEFETWNKESILMKCQNCGSKEVVNSRNIAHKCSFCGSSKMLSVDELPGLKPNGVLPFLVTEKQATKNFMGWLKKKWFTPNDLKKTARINTFSGVYTPTWSYDSNAHTKYKGVLYKRETRTTGDGKTETYTVSIPVSGNRDDSFLDVLIPVGQKIDRFSFKKLEPFKFSNLKVFSKNYLAGFTANHYSVPANIAWESAQEEMKREITQRIVRKHHADGVSYLNMDIVHSNTMYSYLLLPIWVCSYHYKQKIYNFFINGATGKVTGRVPRSAIKIILFILFLIGAIGLIAFLSKTYGGGF